MRSPRFRTRVRLIAAVALLLVSARSGAQLPEIPSSLPGAAEMRVLAPVYKAYADALREHGADGLKQTAASNLKLVTTVGRYTGQAAVHEMAIIYGAFRGDKVTEHVRDFTVRGNVATARVEESVTIGENKAGTAEPVSVTLSWYWKHTWLHTQSGWRLAKIQELSTIEKPKAVVYFTVSSE